MMTSKPNHQTRLSAPIIFIGPGRSGSTVISEFVMAHHSLGWPDNYCEWFPSLPSLAWLTRLTNNSLWYVSGEKAQLNHTLPLNNLLPRPAEAWPFWQKITRDEIDFSRGFLLHQRASAEEKQRIRRYLNQHLRAQGKPRLAMKFTGPGRVEYLSSMFPDALFINVVREPVATVNSLLKVPFWQAQGLHQLWWLGAYSNHELETYQQIRHDPVCSTAFQLNKILKTTEEEISRTKVKSLTVHYEDFVRDPQFIVHQIMHFCHLPPCERVRNKLRNSPIRDQNKAAKVSGIAKRVSTWCENEKTLES
ncbi:TPA: sulfotransferase [Vibrio vulnificus]|uniref:sulfotransferase n=1 Tax=Vibrio vulnificus TaxID=672 RepID=UPI001302B318|nr:sulfotransferase [Vibrio vulnificus]MCU8204632.1 sulfotransferase [Vibrio vulnificus]HAS8422037.1 sulfotransferase [Vibrio vulnificus]